MLVSNRKYRKEERVLTQEKMLENTGEVCNMEMDSVQWYLKQAGSNPLLTKSEEMKLAYLIKTENDFFQFETGYQSGKKIRSIYSFADAIRLDPGRKLRPDQSS